LELLCHFFLYICV